MRKTKLVLRDLEDVIRQKLDAMVAENPGRMDYYERYQVIISNYNGEQDRASIEKTFTELINLAQSLDDEQQRYIREGFTTEEELYVYDILFKPELSKAEIKKIKEVSTELLQKIKTIISVSDHWSDKQETMASVDNVIRDILWAELPECYDEKSITDYRDKVKNYIYERFREAA